MIGDGEDSVRSLLLSKSYLKDSYSCLADLTDEKVTRIGLPKICPHHVVISTLSVLFFVSPLQCTRKWSLLWQQRHRAACEKIIVNHFFFHQVNQMDRQDKVADNILLSWLAGAQHPEELMIFQM